MRIAVSPPWFATGLAVVATLALRVTSPRAPRLAPDDVASEASAGGEAGHVQVRDHADPNRAARAELSQIERELDALTDRVTSAVDAFHAAKSECEIRRTRAELATLRAEIAVERRVLTERARQVRAAVAH